MLLKNKNVIITGTNRGIGKAILEKCAINGANIWAHTRKETPEFDSMIQEVSEKNNVEIRPLYFDLTDYSTMRVAVKKIHASKIPVDALINNAGITYNALFQMSTEENLRQQFEVNFFAPFLFTQYISKIMIKFKGGNIVNIASTAGADGNSGKSVYGASKAALITMTKAIAAELGEYNIRANCISPGMTSTDMLNTIPSEVIRNQNKIADIPRSGVPSEIAAAAVFLASEMSSYITGQVIHPNGGEIVNG